MKKNLKIRKSFKWLSLVLALSIIHCQLSIAIAQYPVRSQAIIKSPYSAALSDYYTGTDAKLQLILTNTDIREPLIHARLQLSIVSNRVTLRSRAFIGSVIELDAGVPKFLSGMDLAIYFNPSNIEILSGLDYNALFKSPRLPDGTYTFRFDVVDAFTGRLLSDPKSLQSPINILSVDPPFLNLPRKGDNMRYTDPLNIIFNWTPRAANKGVTEYTFSLYEILDNGMPPENAPFMSQPIYQTTTQTTTLLYGPTEPPLLPGKRYAWRIRAVAKQGIDSYSIYNNDGYTETFWFQLQDNCDPVKIITATVKGGAVTLEWADNPAMYKYIVQYRKKGDWNRWFSTEPNNNKVIITDVAAGNTYEYQVGGICTVGAGATYSDIRAFTIPPRDSVRDKQCGILPNINLANQKPLEDLGVGEGVMVGDFPATILSVSANGNNSFSGTAAIKLNIFNIAEAAVKASFDNVVFNTDKQLISGFFVTTYDSTEKQIVDLDKVFEGGNDVGKVKTGLDSVDVKINFPIAKPEDIKVTINPDGTAVINATGANGQTKQITVQSLPTTIKDSEGNIYNVDKDGKVTKVGKTGEFKNLNTAQLNNIATDKAIVTFKPHSKQQYAFDEWKEVYNKSNIFKAAYELLSNSYHVSSKAIEAGKTDFVKAVIDIKDRANIIADSVKFVTGKGTRFESKYLGNNEYEITVIGGPSKDAQELYAIYPNSSPNGGGQVGAYLSFGKLLISSYPHQKQKLVLVPVNGASINKQEISKQLNDIYNKIAVEFDVQQDANFNDNSWDINKDGALQVDGSGLFSTLTDEMKALNNAYRTKRTIDKSTIYLFVLSQAAKEGVVGDMPRAKQFGYLFTGNDGKTVAHEVGHGLFHLKHSFDGQYGFAKGELANNVMDYPNGDQFAKLQWDAIHAPGLVIGMFESDGDGMSDNVTIDSLLNWIKKNLGKQANFRKDDFFKYHAWVDVPLSANCGTDEKIVLYVELGDDGLVNMQNTVGVYKNMSLAVHYEGKYAVKYHTGYSLTIPYASNEGSAITIWAYSFDDYSSLLHFLGLDFGEQAKEYFRKKYKQELADAGQDCNKLDVLYENMPPFVIDAIADEDLWAHLVSISSCSMQADQGTDEEKAALNIMRGFKDRKKLYDKLYQNPQVVKELYEGIDGDNCFSYLNILATLTNTYGKAPTEKQYAYIGKVPNNKYPSNLGWNGKDYFTTVGVGNINGLIAVGTQVGRMNISPFNWGSVQVWGDINRFQVNNLLDQGILYRDEEKNMDILPIIYIGHLAEKDGQGKLLSAINTGTMAVGFWGSARVLFAKGAGYIAKAIAFSELSKLAIDAFMSSEANRKEVASWGSEGKWIVDNWTTISTAVDLTTLGGQLLVNFVQNGTKVSSKLRVRGMDKEADELDEMIKSASAVRGMGSLDDLVAWASNNGLSNLTRTELDDIFKFVDNNFDFAKRVALSTKEIKSASTLTELAEKLNLPITPAAKSLTPYQARVWYNWRKAKISDLIDKSQSLENQAKQAFNMRNGIRTGAREAMKDVDISEFLNSKEANRTWQQVYDYYKGDYNKIIEGSMKGRDFVDNIFKLPTVK